MGGSASVDDTRQSLKGSLLSAGDRKAIEETRLGSGMTLLTLPL